MGRAVGFVGEGLGLAYHCAVGEDELADEEVEHVQPVLISLDVVREGRHGKGHLHAFSDFLVKLFAVARRGGSRIVRSGSGHQAS